MEEKIKELEDRIVKLETRNANQDKIKKIKIIVIIVLLIIVSILYYYIFNTYINSITSIL